MIKTLTTYKDVANEAKLGKVTAARFIAYMTKRWKTEEEIQCRSGYASEWAERFASNVEYQASDLNGLRVLKQIDCCLECGERLTDDELLERINNNLTLGEDIVCDDCYNDFMREKIDEEWHPDNKGG